MTLTEEQYLLIAKAIAWNEGWEPERIAEIAASTNYQDAAQLCAEDLGLA